jgi:hypothetical protein
MRQFRARAVRLLACLVLLLPAGGWAQGSARSVRVAGLIYGSWSADLGSGAEGANRFEVNRAYVTLSGALSERVSGRITTDAIREDGEELEVRLKYAFVIYRPERSALAVRFGLTQTPFVEFEEGVWGYRMQGSIPADRLRYLSSSDLGVAVDGRWGQDDAVQATVGVYNGEGWARGEVDSGKDLMARVTVRLARTDDPGTFGGVRVTAYGGVGSPPGGGVRQRALGMLSWRTRGLTLAGQYLLTRDRQDTGTGDTVDGRLLNTFAVVRLPGAAVDLIARLELHDPDRGVEADRQTRWTAGVGHALSPELRILGSLEHLSYQGGAPTPALEATRIRGLFQLALTF